MRYSFRIEPKGWGEDRALRSLFAAEKDLIEQEIQLRLHTALLFRYRAIVEFLANQALTHAYNEAILVKEDQIKVLEKSKYTTDFDLEEVLEAENSLTKLKDRAVQSAKDQDKYLWLIRRILSDASFTGFDTVDLVTVETMDKRMAPLVSDTDNVYTDNERLKSLVSKGEYESEKARNRRYLSRLSFSYDYGRYIKELNQKSHNKEYDLNARYNLEAGFRLPFLSADGREVALRLAEFLADKAGYECAKREVEFKIQRDRSDIGSLIAHYRYLVARQNEVDAEGSLKKYLGRSGVDPLMLLSIKEGIAENKLRMEKTRFDIMRKYISVLDSTGRLSKKPLINYLAESKETIAP
jgi:hypothetical protein